jgi:hypothetical protein
LDVKTELPDELTQKRHPVALLAESKGGELALDHSQLFGGFGFLQLELEGLAGRNGALVGEDVCIAD